MFRICLHQLETAAIYKKCLFCFVSWDRGYTGYSFSYLCVCVCVCVCCSIDQDTINKPIVLRKKEKRKLQTCRIVQV